MLQCNFFGMVTYEAECDQFSCGVVLSHPTTCVHTCAYAGTVVLHFLQEFGHLGTRTCSVHI